MGEYADAMLGGEFCAGCGVYIGKEVGYPRNCFDCEPVHAAKVKCPTCGKKVKEIGLQQHINAVHKSND